MQEVSTSRLRRDLQTLAGDIGERLAGSANEREAADYIAGEFSRAGADVSIEEFPMRERAVNSERMEIYLGDRWESFPASLFSNTPGTDGGTVEAPLVFMESPAEMDRSDLSHLKDKAVLMLGCHIESRPAYRRLIEAGPLFLLMVDIRYPGSTPLADGMFPAYTTGIGAVPMMNVAYQDAWRWRSESAASARLTVAGGMRESVSQNVIADIPGTDPEAGILYMGAHHDTQADSPGADDNATGVLGVLECARLLANRPHRRTLRLISFGCEEQLSVGSAAYVRAHRDEIRQNGKFMFNLDSYGSGLGWNELVVNGPDELVDVIRKSYEPRNIFFRFAANVMPYADHFPFVAAGVPATTWIRYNCTAGRFFHHRPDDDISRVDIPTVADILNAVLPFMADLAERKNLPFPTFIPAAIREGVDEYWDDLFGGWDPRGADLPG